MQEYCVNSVYWASAIIVLRVYVRYREGCVQILGTTKGGAQNLYAKV